MSTIGHRKSVAVTFIGKLKTVLQMVSLVLLLGYDPTHHYLIGLLGYGLLYIAAALTLWSIVMYLKIAWPDLSVKS